MKIDNFNSKYEVNTVTKCWEWTAYRNVSGVNHGN